MNLNAAIRLDPKDAELRRRDERSDCDAPIAVREMGAFPSHAKLVNISARGFMAEVAGPFEPNARVWLLLPGRKRVSARIVWVKDGRIGGEFSDAVDPLAIIQAAGERGL